MHYKELDGNQPGRNRKMIIATVFRSLLELENFVAASKTPLSVESIEVIEDVLRVVFKRGV
jgi:hypothetical protein